MEENEELNRYLRSEPAAITRLPNGWYRIEKAGYVGVGETPELAAMDLGEKIAVASRKESKS